MKYENKKIKFYKLKEKEIVESVNKKQEKVYSIKVEMERNEEVIKRKMTRGGRFILATNIVEEKQISSSEILLNYKKSTFVVREGLDF